MQDTTHGVSNILGAGHAIFGIEQPPWGLTIQCTKCGQGLSMGIALVRQVASGTVTITDHALTQKCEADN